MIRKFLIGLLVLLGLTGAALADGPSKVQVGAYVLRINNVSQKDGTFNVDMWLWFRWQGADPKAYDVASAKLAQMFQKNFAKFEAYVDAEVMRAGPSLATQAAAE